MPSRRAKLPELPDTGRRYLDGTQRARLASPGIERFVPERRGGRLAALGLAALAVLAGAAAWLASR